MTDSGQKDVFLMVTLFGLSISGRLQIMVMLLHNLTILPLPNVSLLDCAADVEDKEGDEAAKNDEQGASRGLENVVSRCENIALPHNSLFDFYQ